MKNSRKNPRTWIEIDRKVIKFNIKILKNFLRPGCRLMAVVKSNAYGHGLVPFAKEVSHLGADFLGVDDLDEALELRAHGIKLPILVFNYTPIFRYAEARRRNISLTVSSLDVLNKAARMKSLPKLHLKFDTGLGRQGFLQSQVKEVMRLLQTRRFPIKGVYTHLAAAENPAQVSYTRRQMRIFGKWIKEFAKISINPIRHALPSAGVMLYPDFHFDMVRAGIALYGLWPSPETRAAVLKENPEIHLKPVMNWKTIVTDVKTLSRENYVGYDRTAKLKRRSRVAVCPVGYWHGYPRALSGRGVVLVRGQRARILGRVCMDMMMIDVTSIPGVKTGDEAVLIGRQGKQEISAEELAKLASTINYEIVTRINQDIPRVYN